MTHAQPDPAPFSDSRALVVVGGSRGGGQPQGENRAWHGIESPFLAQLIAAKARIADHARAWRQTPQAGCAGYLKASNLVQGTTRGRHAAVVVV